jgi:iron complex transport system substrate-binding protein
MTTNELTLHGTIKAPARRIASLAPSVTETLFYLGLGDCLVGVTRQCDYPPEADRVEKTGAFAVPDIDRIKALQPDAVIGLADLHQHLAQSADNGGPPLLLLDHRTVAGILDAMDALASLAPDAAAATDLVTALRQRIAALPAPPPEPVRTLFMTFDNPVITPGKGSYQYDALRTAGAAQMTLSYSTYERVTLEEIVHYDPEVILACGRHRGQPARPVCPNCQAEHPVCQRIVEDIAAAPGWRETSAARNGHLLAIPCDWLCRPGPRLIGGIERIASIIAAYRTGQK